MRSSYFHILFFVALLLCACENNTIKKKSENSSLSKAKDTKKEVQQKTITKLKPKPKLPGFASKEDIKKFCDLTQKSFTRYGWGKSSCESYPWRYFGKSNKGTPLLWVKFGEYEESPELVETTLLMCGVHGDEITPIKFCFDSLAYLTRIEKGLEKDPDTGSVADLKGKFVALIPIVNPDSYFKKYPTRTNANGVDVNRNFPTSDFDEVAMKLWKERYHSDKRRYPGKESMSEPETVFQVKLIEMFKPDKIISVHSPLTMLDYDGPADLSSGGSVGPRANQLLIQMSQGAKGYRIKNYPFFPGSLGNYAGNERNIPTYTLELPSSDNRLHDVYWERFKPSIYSAVMHTINRNIDVALKPDKSSSEIGTTTN